MYPLLFALIFSAGAFAGEFNPFTTLRAAGNDEVVQRYQAYAKSGQACAPLNSGHRVILTGFGLWSDLSLSYSGYVIDNLGTPEFLAKDSTHPRPPKSYVPRNGRLELNEGARIVNRVLRLPNGREVSACLILVDVLWDFAGAVIVNEMDRFQPDVVVMTGIGSHATVEGGAENYANAMEGYFADGKADEFNFPVKEPILPQFPVGSKIAMTWDVNKVAKAVRPFEPSVVVHHEANPTNTYICNNVSYIALQAAAGTKISLAGGKLEIHPSVRGKPRIGFYHYNSATPGDLKTLERNAEMLLAIVGAAL